MGANKQPKTDVRGRDAQGGLLGTRISKGLRYFVTKETRYLMSKSNLEIREYLVTRKKKKKNNKTNSIRCYNVSWNIKERFFFNLFTYLGSHPLPRIYINKYFIVTKVIPYFTYEYTQL